MKKIRLHTFETNSSSVHSMTVGPMSQTLESVSPDEDGVLRIYVNEDYWGDYDQLNHIQSKIEYAASDGSGVSREMLTEALMMHTGALEVEYIDNTDYGVHEYGLEEISSASELVLFLVNPNSYISISYDG